MTALSTHQERATNPLDIMEQIVTRRARKFQPDKFVDHYQAAVKELIAEKLAGKLPERPPERKPAQVINLMDALKRSLAEEGEEKTGGKARPRSAKSSKPQQPSLLLPVRGGRVDKPKTPARAWPMRSRSWGGRVERDSIPTRSRS